MNIDMINGKMTLLEKGIMNGQLKIGRKFLKKMKVRNLILLIINGIYLCILLYILLYIYYVIYIIIKLK